jgi:hypothetical protein
VILRRPRTFWTAVCNLVGLGFSLAGVVLLFFYALPIEPPLGPHILTDSGLPGAEAQLETYHRLTYAGLALVVVGTIMEAVPPFFVALGSWRRSPPPTV